MWPAATYNGYYKSYVLDLLIIGKGRRPLPKALLLQSNAGSKAAL